MKFVTIKKEVILLGSPDLFGDIVAASLYLAKFSW